MTEEQRTEIQQDVARIVESLVSAAKLKEDEVVHFMQPPHGAREFFRAMEEYLQAGELAPIRPARGLAPEEKLALSKLAADAAMESLARAAQRTGAQPASSQTQPPLEPLVRIIARAVEVLGTSEKALRWINAPVRSLGDQPPASLLGTPEGRARVEDALGRIEHGVW